MHKTYVCGLFERTGRAILKLEDLEIVTGAQHKMLQVP